MQGLDSNPAGTLRILNMPVDSQETPSISLDLRRADSVTQSTQFVVVDEHGEHPLQVDTGARFTGTVEGQTDAPAFVSIAPDGSIRSIIHQGGQVIVSEFQPGSRATVSSTVSRALAMDSAISERAFDCAVEPARLDLHPTGAPAALMSRLSQPETSGPVTQALQSTRRADIIVDSDYEFFQKLGSTTAAATYVADLFTYISQKYQGEISTRFNLKKVIIRNTSSDPWSANNASAMLDEVMNYWNSNASNPDRTLTRHHVHLLSGKAVSTSIAYVDTLGMQSYAYGVSAAIGGDFTPQNPQIIWDTVVVAHEIGHAFGSSHTHDYDNYSGQSLVPSPNTGGAIDCCYSQTSGSQCAVALGGIQRTGFLPGAGVINGGSQGQRNGTIMSYCHLLPGGMANTAWSFGTSHPYGSNPGRVPQVMTAQAQTYLPADDSAATFSLSVGKTGTGTITSAPSGINCGATCTAAYSQGTSVTLTATPGSGYSFAGWGGACSGTGTCTVAMTADKSVQATFSAVTGTKTLTVNKTGTGTGTGTVTLNSTYECSSANTTCSWPFNTGTTITLQAIPSTGSTFGGWSGGTCSGTGACSFTLNADTTVTAAFNLQSGGGTCQARAFSAGEERVLGAYIAYYGRPADAGGLAYWAKRMSDEGGSIWSIIEPFGNSNEYRQRFGSLGNTDLINNLYQQMYGRSADNSGLTFYTNMLDTGRGTLASIAINIMDGTSGSDATVLENRRKVARHYVTRMEAKGASAPAISDVALANLLATVQATTTSTNTACTTLTGWIN